MCDANFNRIKIKGAEYLAKFHFHSSLSNKSILDVVRRGEEEEAKILLKDNPHICQKVDEIKKRYDELVDNIEMEYYSIKDAPTQKEYALLAKSTPFSGILFGLYHKKFATVKEGLLGMHLKNLMELLKVKEEVA